MAKALPLPGRPVRGRPTGRPVLALLDLLGRRGTLRLLWELRDGQPQGFRLLQASTGGISPSVLSERLRQLRDARIAQLGSDGYRLTPAGIDLMRRLQPLNRWAESWAHDDPSLIS